MRGGRFFMGAAILGGAVALKFGAPIVAVLLGILAMGAVNRWTARRRVSRAT